jgi:hypothetical protein
MIRSKVKLRPIALRHQQKLAETQGIWGYAEQEEFNIVLEKIQPPREYLNTLIHEMIHCILPDLSEKSVIKMSNIMSDIIWKQRFRRVPKNQSLRLKPNNYANKTRTRPASNRPITKSSPKRQAERRVKADSPKLD